MTKIKNIIDIKTLKFILVGCINTAVGAGVMFLLYNVAGLYQIGDTGYWISTAANYVVGSIVSFFLNKYFTFGSKSKNKKEIWRFIINITICYLIAYGIAQPITTWALNGVEAQLQTNIAMIVGMVLFVGFNYLGQRFWVFKDTEKDTPSQTQN